MKKRQVQSLAFVGLILLCGLDVGCLDGYPHPYTSIGAIGYKNVGIDKDIEMDVVGEEGGLPLDVDINGDGRPERVRLYRFKVQNDLTQGYQMNQMILEQQAMLFKTLIELLASRVTGSFDISNNKPPQSGQTDSGGSGGSRLSRGLKEIITVVDELEAEGIDVSPILRRFGIERVIRKPSPATQSGGVQANTINRKCREVWDIEPRHYRYLAAAGEK